ncbi:MAG: glycoside hydrolase family 76 protein [Bacteroidota bacterium]|nr:glycoside hydrolase family 76 protein [Bacteroidota bacterium]
MIIAGAAVLFAVVIPSQQRKGHDVPDDRPVADVYRPSDPWVQRAYMIRDLYEKKYVPGWEAANGAIGDAYLFAVTGDSALLRFHMNVHPLTELFNGSWVDDRAWDALAELTWWEFTGRTNRLLVESARERYLSAKREGRLSNHEGFWSWYNWPPSYTAEPVFTNSNMNQMVNVACRLYEATGDRTFLDDARKVWHGDGKTPGIEKMWYRGKGLWKGTEGPAAFGKQLPWNGAECCSIAAALYRVTNDPKYRDIAVATARRILDPKTGWVHPERFYQLHMDGNGAFVHYLFDAYSIAPDKLADVPSKVERMLEHVWSNSDGKARVTLHREADHGIRNGWNPQGGEDGYGVDGIGTLHAQSQALRAFGVFCYYRLKPPSR